MAEGYKSMNNLIIVSILIMIIWGLTGGPRDIALTCIIITWCLIGLLGTFIWRKMDKTVPLLLGIYGPLVFLFRSIISKLK